MNSNDRFGIMCISSRKSQNIPDEPSLRDPITRICFPIYELSVPLRPFSILYCEGGAVVQTSQTRHAMVLHPRGSTVFHLYGLRRTVFGTYSASYATFVDAERFSFRILVKIGVYCRQWVVQSEPIPVHAPSFHDPMSHLVNCLLRAYRFSVAFIPVAHIKHRRVSIHHSYGKVCVTLNSFLF